MFHFVFAVLNICLDSVATVVWTFHHFSR